MRRCNPDTERCLSFPEATAAIRGLLFGFVMFAVGGCAGLALSAGHGDEVPLPDVVPEQLIPLGQDLTRHHVRITRVQDATVLDASGTNVVFPLTEAPRQFQSRRAVQDALQERFGGTLYPQSDGTTGVGVRVVQLGSSYWIEQQTQRVYRIQDPVLAWLGGTTGTIIVGAHSICIDPDGSCTNGPPSYLSLAARPTYPSHIRACNDAGPDRWCYEFHSFMNKVDLGLLKYASHGANSRITSGRFEEVQRLVTCPASGTHSMAVTRLETRLMTGSDDLRDQSHAWMTVTLATRTGLPPPPQRGALPRVSLNDGAGLSGNSSFQGAPVALPAGTLLGHVSMIAITHESVQRNPFDTRDNWNMDGIIVTAVTDEGRHTILSRTGRPVHRFSGDEPSWSQGISIDSPEPRLCVRTLPARLLAVDGGTLFSDGSPLGAPRGVTFVPWLRLPPASGQGVNAVETRLTFFGIAVSSDEYGSLGRGTAPDDAVFLSVGMCAAHRAERISGTTGNGRHPDGGC
jgi:hypothetical protein